MEKTKFYGNMEKRVVFPPGQVGMWTMIVLLSFIHSALGKSSVLFSTFFSPAIYKLFCKHYIFQIELGLESLSKLQFPVFNVRVIIASLVDR
jgi:hypothetical protein